MASAMTTGVTGSEWDADGLVGLRECDRGQRRKQGSNSSRFAGDQPERVRHENPLVVRPWSGGPTTPVPAAANAAPLDVLISSRPSIAVTTSVDNSTKRGRQSRLRFRGDIRRRGLSGPGSLETPACFLDAAALLLRSSVSALAIAASTSRA